MPRYQYACPDCGYSFEAQQKFTDKPLKKCPNCSKRSIYKMINNVSVAFKGTGFYINDSKKGDDKKSVKPKGDDAVATESASPDAGASGEGKDATKTETTATETKPAESTSTESKTETKAASSDAKKSEGKAEKKEKKTK
jgi:putative FmdB family regulatory protein